MRWTRWSMTHFTAAAHMTELLHSLKRNKNNPQSTTLIFFMNNTNLIGPCSYYFTILIFTHSSIFCIYSCFLYKCWNYNILFFLLKIIIIIIIIFQIYFYFTPRDDWSSPLLCMIPLFQVLKSKMRKRCVVIFIEN